MNEIFYYAIHFFTLTHTNQIGSNIPKINVVIFLRIRNDPGWQEGFKTQGALEDFPAKVSAISRLKCNTGKRL
ncbi:hypothetical protein OKW21_003238 [Catalinimonas alkaloidigena]|uniref:hypothetical protein n=1 Tax=Catalinimonas alkaloidigena TaxID=1075417 RepID=UPI002405A482|nr:hypothetical protein [Catalinimonas alkaloidigena]MDF9797975.1 hypothetical protein [Catalinimonas alkaloidigena]